MSLNRALYARATLSKCPWMFLATYLHIDFFSHKHKTPFEPKRKMREKKIAQGHIHLPILAKFFYLMPSHFFFRLSADSNAIGLVSDRVRFCVFRRSLLLLFLIWLSVVQFLYYRFNLSFYVHIKYINNICASLYCCCRCGCRCRWYLCEFFSRLLFWFLLQM